MRKVMLLIIFYELILVSCLAQTNNYENFTLEINRHKYMMKEGDTLNSVLLKLGLTKELGPENAVKLTVSKNGFRDIDIENLKEGDVILLPYIKDFNYENEVTLKREMDFRFAYGASNYALTQIDNALELSSGQVAYNSIYLAGKYKKDKYTLDVSLESDGFEINSGINNVSDRFNQIQFNGIYKDKYMVGVELSESPMLSVGADEETIFLDTISTTILKVGYKYSFHFPYIYPVDATISGSLGMPISHSSNSSIRSISGVSGYTMQVTGSIEKEFKKINEYQFSYYGRSSFKRKDLSIKESGSTSKLSYNFLSFGAGIKVDF